MFGHTLSSLRLRNNRSQSLRPSLDALESRCVASTTVANGPNGLFVSGDAKNQTITITQTGNGQYKVQAADMPSGSKVFSGVNYISVITKGGTDTVNLVGNGGQALQNGIEVRGSGNLTVNNHQFNVNVSVGSFIVRDADAKSIKVHIDPGTMLGAEFKMTAGAGDDEVVMPANCYVKGQVYMNLGSGNNRVLVDHAIIDGTFTVVGTSGNDAVSLVGAQFGSFNPGSVVLNLGAGTNMINLDGVGVNGNVVITCNKGVANLSATDAKIFGNVNFVGGAANALVAGSTITGKMEFIDHGNLNDNIRILNSQIGGNFTAHTDKGEDSVRVENSTIAKTCESVGGGKGHFTAVNATINGSLVLTYSQASAAANISVQGGSIRDNLQVQTGAFNDTIALHGVSVGSMDHACSATIFTGRGNDYVDLTGTVFNSSDIHFDGDADSNWLRMGGVQIRRAQPAIFHFNIG